MSLHCKQGIKLKKMSYMGIWNKFPSCKKVSNLSSNVIILIMLGFKCDKDFGDTFMFQVFP